MRLDKVKIILPIIKSEKSKYYSLILTDSASIEHYFNHDGTYDGYSHDPHLCGKTSACSN